MVTLCNTRSVDTKSITLSRNFARGVAGESGRPLLPYMLKLVDDVHRAFPDMAIIACAAFFQEKTLGKHMKTVQLCFRYILLLPSMVLVL